MTWYGFYKVGQTNVKKRSFVKEKREARMAIAPLLQSEQDAKYVLAKKAMDADEAKLMAGVPGWEVGASAYKTRYQTPTLWPTAPEW